MNFPGKPLIAHELRCQLGRPCCPQRLLILAIVLAGPLVNVIRYLDLWQLSQIPCPGKALVADGMYLRLPGGEYLGDLMLSRGRMLPWRWDDPPWFSLLQFGLFAATVFALVLMATRSWKNSFASDLPQNLPNVSGNPRQLLLARFFPWALAAALMLTAYVAVELLQTVTVLLFALTDSCLLLTRVPYGPANPWPGALAMEGHKLLVAGGALGWILFVLGLAMLHVHLRVRPVPSAFSALYISLPLVLLAHAPLICDQLRLLQINSWQYWRRYLSPQPLSLFLFWPFLVIVFEGIVKVWKKQHANLTQG